MAQRIFNRIIESCGNLSAILITVLIFLIIVDISMRYFLGLSKVWMMELEWHLFSAAFLFAINYSLATDKHIRVDVFYNKMSLRKKSLINILSSLFLLIPWSIISFKSSVLYTYSSFIISETTADPGGLPFRFIIKSIIPAMFFLLIIQGIFIVKNELKIYFNKSPIN